MGSIRRIKTKRLTRGLDQVYNDLRSSSHLSRHKSSKPAEDLPGLGRFYCVECAKWFESKHSLSQHQRGKNHKRRCKALKEIPFGQKEAETAAGLGVDDFIRTRKYLEMKASREEGTLDDAAAMELQVAENLM